jgi:hypothetical protein
MVYSMPVVIYAKRYTDVYRMVSRIVFLSAPVFSVKRVYHWCLPHDCMGPIVVFMQAKTRARWAIISGSSWVPNNACEDGS